MQPPSLPSSSRSDGDERHQCWKDVEAETGFSTYKSFSEALNETRPQFKDLLPILDYRYRRYDLGDVFVLDILKDKSMSISWRVKSEKGSFPRLPRGLEASEVSTQLLQHLRSPPRNVQARIVRWSISRDCLPHPSMIETLGLGLRICSSFFETLLSIMNFEMRRLDGQECVKIGDNVAVVTRNYRFEEGAPPVVLVAGETDLESDYRDPSDIWERPHTPHHEVVERVMSWEITGGMLPCRSAIDKLSRSDVEFVSSSQYLNLVQKYVQDNNGIEAESDALPLIAMLPLLQLEVLHLRIQCETVKSELLGFQHRVEHPRWYRPEHTQELFQSMDNQRFWLRRRLEGLEESRIRFVKFIYLQNAEKWLKGRTWLSQDENITEVVTEARAKDAEARDYMQLQIGNLSILESRKSIELSTQQIDDAKRGKKFQLIDC